MKKEILNWYQQKLIDECDDELIKQKWSEIKNEINELKKKVNIIRLNNKYSKEV